METLIKILLASWQVLQEAAIYLLLGFVIAGLLRAYVRPDTVVRYFHRGRLRSVAYAALLGIPIPL